MIDLNDENDPILFAIALPNGKLVLQFMEVISEIHATMPAGTDKEAQIPTDLLCKAIRRVARTPLVAANAPDHQLVAAWGRMAQAVESSGKT